MEISDLNILCSYCINHIDMCLWIGDIMLPLIAWWYENPDSNSRVWFNSWGLIARANHIWYGMPSCGRGTPQQGVRPLKKNLNKKNIKTVVNQGKIIFMSFTQWSKLIFIGKDKRAKMISCKSCHFFQIFQVPKDTVWGRSINRLIRKV